jgi:phytoene desaturase
MKKSVIIIGAGFSGMSSACYLAKAGFDVTIIDKLDAVGGRCRQIKEDGFTFDMGPTFFWMPDVYDRFFTEISGKTTSEIIDLRILDPAYKIFFEKDEITIHGTYVQTKKLFESIEVGAGNALDNFIANSKTKYDLAIKNYLYKPNQSATEFITLNAVTDIFKLDLLTSHADFVRRFFENNKLVTVTEWPVLFLGGAPRDISAMYSLLVYSAMMNGTWYPVGGMYEIVKAIQTIMTGMGVKVILNTEIKKVICGYNSIEQIIDSNGKSYSADYIVASCDYHHFESVLSPRYRVYSEKYWDTRVLAPSALLFYLGFNTKIPGLIHHNLFFHEDFDNQVNKIFCRPDYTDKPLFYVCCPSKTDSTVVPDNLYENLYVLVPLAPGLEDSDIWREKLFEIVMTAIESKTGSTDLHNHLVYKKSFGINDFVLNYNSYKANAYGLSNTLTQTACMKPLQKSTTLKNLYYAGQSTNPGGGIPPCLISGRIVSELIVRDSMGSQSEEDYFDNFFYDLFIRITLFCVIIYNYLMGQF